MTRLPFEVVEAQHPVPARLSAFVPMRLRASIRVFDTVELESASPGGHIGFVVTDQHVETWSWWEWRARCWSVRRDGVLHRREWPWWRKVTR